jgi:dienelactone hydrolase
MKLRGIFVALTVVMGAQLAHAKVVSREVEYKDGSQNLKGYLAYDDEAKGLRPGVIVVHDWMGLGAFSTQKADELAKLGYVAFAADIYGVGQRPKDMKEASEYATKYKGDRALLRSRVNAALSTLRAQKVVDAKRVAAIGFCFGGTTALELGRSGTDVKAIVSFHGGLNNPTPADAKNIKGHVLVLHGADDPWVDEKEVAAFTQEMRASKVDWQFHSFSGAVHAFMVPGAGNDPKTGAAYNKVASDRAWSMMKDFFKETL